MNIPVDALAGRIAELGAPDDGSVHLVCRSGGWSSRAADLLVGEGFSAVNVKGGTLAWVAAGYGTE